MCCSEKRDFFRVLVAFVLLGFLNKISGECVIDDTGTPILAGDVDKSDLAMKSSCDPLRYNHLINANQITACSVQHWQELVKPLWTKKIESDWLGIGDQHHKIVERVQADNLTWEQLCYHPSYFTYMECVSTGLVSQQNDNTSYADATNETGKCRCYSAFENFTMDNTSGLCMIREKSPCGYDEICAGRLKCISGVCAPHNLAGTEEMSSDVIAMMLATLKVLFWLQPYLV